LQRCKPLSALTEAIFPKFNISNIFINPLKTFQT
jgi:hypothetical protein